MYTARSSTCRPCRRSPARCGCRVEEHFQPRPPARRLRLGRHHARGPAPLRRHAGHARGADWARLPAPRATALDLASQVSAAGRPSAQRELNLGNAGTAMRPLLAALAITRRALAPPTSCMARARMHEGRSATWSMRCARSVAGSTSSAAPATRRCAWGAGAAAARRRGRGRRRPSFACGRRLEPVPHRAPAGPAAALVAVPGGDRG